MRFAHSFWKDPFCSRNNSDKLHDTLAANRLYFLISALLVKRHGYKIDLHTSSGSLPHIDADVYDNVYLSLDTPKLKGISLKLWAAGKICAYESPQWESSHIHLDGDVFLLKDEIFRLLENSNEYDLVVQSEESGKFYDNITAGYKEKLKTFIQGKVPNELWFNKSAYNCGIVKFNNDKLRKKFLHNYFKLAENLSENNEFINDNDQSFTADLIVEQEMLYMLARDLKIKTVIDDMEGFMSSCYCDSLGYKHFMGGFKFGKGLVAEQLDLLKTLDAVKHREMQYLLND